MAQGLSLLVNATREQLGIFSKKNRQKIFFYSYSLFMEQHFFRRGAQFLHVWSV